MLNSGNRMRFGVGFWKAEVEATNLSLCAQNNDAQVQYSLHAQKHIDISYYNIH